VDGDEIKQEKNGRKYSIITREYMAQGHDGFAALKGNKYLIDDEVGQMFSTLVRQYLLVSHQTRPLNCGRILIATMIYFRDRDTSIEWLAYLTRPTFT
jgi:hypothetical protein